MAVFNGTQASGGAPTLNGINGSLVAVLDFWLVTTAGYTILSSSGNERIYLPPAGLGYALYVGDDSSISGSGQNATVRICESTSVIGALVNAAPTVANQSNATCRWGKSTAATATAVPYDITVSDGLGITPPFLTFTAIPGSSSGGTQYWGDGLPQDANDPYCNYLSMMTSAGNGIATAGSWLNACGNIPSGMSTSANIGQFVSARNRDGTIVGPMAMYITGGPASESGTMIGGPVYPHPDTGGMHHEYPVMGCMASYSRSTSGAKAIMSRAILPGVRNLLHNTYTGIAYPDDWNDTAHSASAVFKFISAGGGSAFGSEITDTFVTPGIG